MTPQRAQKAIASGNAPARLHVSGTLYLNEQVSSLPEELEAKEIVITNAMNLQSLPRQLRCHTLRLQGTGIAQIHAGVQVSDTLELRDCHQLSQFPEHLRLHALRLRNCPAIQHLPSHLQVSHNLILENMHLIALPENLDVHLLKLADCTQLRHWPAHIRIRDQLEIIGCDHLTTLPRGLRLNGLRILSCENLTMLLEDLVVIDEKVEPDPQLLSRSSGIHVSFLSISNCPKLRQLPSEMTVTHTLNLNGCSQIRQLWQGLQLQSLCLVGCTGLTELPDDLQVKDSLYLNDCASLKALPASLTRLQTLSVSGCRSLQSLPESLEVDELRASDCTNLRALPESLHVRTLDISGCRNLSAWSTNRIKGLRNLYMHGCHGLSSLPPGYTDFQSLDISDCPQIEELPAHLHISDWLNIGGTALRALPHSLGGFKLRWNGVVVPGHLVLHPQAITARRVLNEGNQEVRRILLERMGIARFVREAQPDILDADEDRGGPRSLLRIELRGDESLVCLQVQDPSTGRQYLLRVPPTMTSCHQAAAWVAGFDNPDDYHPVQET